MRKLTKADTYTLPALSTTKDSKRNSYKNVAEQNKTGV